MNCKETFHTTNSNPLNSRLTFENSYMTDFLQGLINSGNKLKAIPIENGWLELDSMDDHKIYEDLHRTNNLKKFFEMKKNE